MHDAKTGGRRLLYALDALSPSAPEVPSIINGYDNAAVAFSDRWKGRGGAVEDGDIGMRDHDVARGWEAQCARNCWNERCRRNDSQSIQFSVLTEEKIIATRIKRDKISASSFYTDVRNERCFVARNVRTVPERSCDVRSPLQVSQKRVSQVTSLASAESAHSAYE